jgi:hypothetical protein
MAKRLLPYQKENPYDIIVGYALDDSFINNNPSVTGFGDEGVLVTVSAANLDLDPVSFSADSYLGKTSYNGVGWNQRPSLTRKIKPAVSGDIPLGFTKMETALYDENGEYFSRYKQKAIECNVAIKGQDVPILTKGELDLSVLAIDGTLTVGQGIKPSTTSGKVTGCTFSDNQRFGVVLGTGSRGTSNRGTYADGWSGFHAIVKFDCK